MYLEWLIWRELDIHSLPEVPRVAWLWVEGRFRSIGCRPRLDTDCTQVRAIHVKPQSKLDKNIRGGYMRNWSQCYERKLIDEQFINWWFIFLMSRILRYFFSLFVFTIKEKHVDRKVPFDGQKTKERLFILNGWLQLQTSARTSFRCRYLYSWLVWLGFFTYNYFCEAEPHLQA